MYFLIYEIKSFVFFGNLSHAWHKSCNISFPERHGCDSYVVVVTVDLLCSNSVYKSLANLYFSKKSKKRKFLLMANYVNSMIHCLDNSIILDALEG